MTQKPVIGPVEGKLPQFTLRSLALGEQYLAPADDGDSPLHAVHRADSQIVVGAFDGDRLVGSLRYEDLQERLYVHMVYVHPRYRTSMLFQQFIDVLTQSGKRIDSWIVNPRLRELVERRSGLTQRQVTSYQPSVEI